MLNRGSPGMTSQVLRSDLPETALGGFNLGRERLVWGAKQPWWGSLPLDKLLPDVTVVAQFLQRSAGTRCALVMRAVQQFGLIAPRHEVIEDAEHPLLQCHSSRYIAFLSSDLAAQYLPAKYVTFSCASARRSRASSILSRCSFVIGPANVTPPLLGSRMMSSGWG